METLLGKSLSDLGRLVSEKWYAGMTAAGLLTMIWALLAGTPHDDFGVGMLGLAMTAFGAAEAETRTFQKRLGQHLGMIVTLTQDIRRLTILGAWLYTIAACSIVVVLLRALWLLATA